MSTPTVLTMRSRELLAETVAARLVTTLVELQSSGRVPHWVLTGGTIADDFHRAIGAAAVRDAVDWSRLHLWWGDERYLPRGDPERNETQARAALIDHVNVDPALVHAMPAADEGTGDPEDAAAAYAEELARCASPEDHGSTPIFDILMLGVGPDGHVASLFPERPALYDERTVVGVRASPKPPPVRVSMTMNTLNRSREVWFIVSGEDKAQAVQLALEGAGTYQVPAAGPHGISRTLWMLDSDAASRLPGNLSQA
jgi:6-phosphogluconolactonase